MNRSLSGYDFNRFAAGNKIYNAGSNSPNMGMALDPMGYRERDLETKTQRNAMLRMLKQRQSGNYNAPDALRSQSIMRNV